MELPYAGRAIIYDNFDGTDITIPTQKNWLIIIFLGFWLLMWSVGIIAIVFSGATEGANDTMPGAVILIMLCFWAAVMIIPIRIFLWNVIGKEIIHIEQGVITLDKKGLLFYKTKSYDLNEARNFRAQEDTSIMMTPFGIRPSGFFKMNSSGTIRFDYGLQTVRFANNMDEVEANFILQKLRDKKLIS